MSCDPEIDVPQCTGASTVPDWCGCPVLVNDYYEDTVIAAQNAYDAWVEAGCGPQPCGAACAIGSDGVCGEEYGTCAWK